MFGGAAFVLGYGRVRTTDDADLLLDDVECQTLIDSAGFGEAIEATNQELEPRGLYLSHIFGRLSSRCSHRTGEPAAAPSFFLGFSGSRSRVSGQSTLRSPRWVELMTPTSRISSFF